MFHSEIIVSFTEASVTTVTLKMASSLHLRSASSIPFIFRYCHWKVIHEKVSFLAPLSRCVFCFVLFLIVCTFSLTIRPKKRFFSGMHLITSLSPPRAVGKWRLQGNLPFKLLTFHIFWSRKVEVLADSNGDPNPELNSKSRAQKPQLDRKSTQYIFK